MKLTLHTIGTLTAGATIIAGLLVVLARWSTTPAITLAIIAAIAFGLDGLMAYVRREMAWWTRGVER